MSYASLRHLYQSKTQYNNKKRNDVKLVPQCVLMEKEKEKK
jgi:hypothetical protein